ncbi:MAG: 30S ribosomal protein S12, partial [Thermoplasmata archaeon]
MGRGLYSARKLKADRQKFRWHDRHYKRRILEL